MRKTSCFLALLLALTMALAGCSSGSSSSQAPDASGSAPASASASVATSSSAPAADVDTAKLADDMYKAMTFDEEMLEVQKEVLPNIYEYDAECVGSFKVYVCATGGSADEIAVFQATSDENVEYLEQMVGYRLDTLKSNFEDYRPDEMVKIENAKVLKSGRIVALVMAADTAPAESVFDAAF